MINIALKKINDTLKFILFKKKWRKKNRHNNTTVKNLFPIDKVTVGEKTYGALHIKTYSNPNEKLTIGSYCSIAGNVKFLLGGEHSYKGFSTYPFKKYICRLKENTLTKGPIVIQDDVWIGEGCLILSGVTIGQGSIVAAGSVVAKDIPPYAIYAGGNVIRYRFSKEIIKQLLKFDYTLLSEELIKSNIDLLYSDLNSDVLNNIYNVSNQRSE